MFDESSFTRVGPGLLLALAIGASGCLAAVDPEEVGAASLADDGATTTPTTTTPTTTGQPPCGAGMLLSAYGYGPAPWSGNGGGLVSGSYYPGGPGGFYPGAYGGGFYPGAYGGPLYPNLYRGGYYPGGYGSFYPTAYGGGYYPGYYGAPYYGGQPTCTPSGSSG
jgi:hypothetical protein